MKSATLDLRRVGLSVPNIARLLKLHRKTVYRCVGRHSLLDRPRPGRPLSVATSSLGKTVNESGAEYYRSMRKMASETNVSTATMRRVAKNELGLNPYQFRQLHGLTPAQMEGRMNVRRMRKAPRATRPPKMLFTDEKLF